MIFIAGQDLYESMQAERTAAIEASGIPYGYGRSEVLCRVQEKQAGRGLTGAQIVRSMYGFSVRYDSGLQNWGLLKSARGSSDPSLEAAKQFCLDWVAQAPNSRYAWMSEGEAEGVAA
jgi:hypothetical protein